MKKSIFAFLLSAAALPATAAPALAGPGCYLVTESGIRISLESICYTAEEVSLLRNAAALSQSADDLDVAAAAYESTLLDAANNPFLTVGGALVINEELAEVDEDYALSNYAEEVASNREAIAQNSLRSRQTRLPESVANLTRDQVTAWEWATLTTVGTPMSR